MNPRAPHRVLARKLIELTRNVLAPSPLVPIRARAALYRWSGLNIGASTIFPRSYFVGSNTTLGDATFVNHSCLFHNPHSEIRIGDRTWIAMNVTFTTSTHDIGSARCRAGSPKRKPIVVGSGCWIGASATILPGVTIGDGCIIAAGAVVIENCEPHGMYAGVPARRIRDLGSR